eukprot:CAMPEP_0168172584 /NCGR_PEP_ID=MMETSP0139_2-20121125/5352_1 /TAXON_ID=44445 /ORGANISM="Pseudo-nitzschia australis, Strain 10249 10 AB" /LENGTH=181 /DNA_ID=CAMNT_0008090285 /DNA_START=135 /DNA_END=678 /DNA_ORIENTATION=+
MVMNESAGEITDTGWVYVHASVKQNKRRLCGWQNESVTTELASNHLPHLLDCMECIAPNHDSNGKNSNSDQNSSPILNNLYQQVSDLAIQLRKCTGLVEAVLGLDQAPEEFLVRPKYQEELQEVHRELEIVQESVRDEHENIQEAWNNVSSSSSSSSSGNNKASHVQLERVPPLRHRRRGW